MAVTKEQIVKITEEENKWRGSECVNLIASENAMSPLARRVYASEFMHRYAEGLPHQRFYQGTKYVDDVEDACIELMKQAYGCSKADVRPTGGAVANMAVLAALANPGDSTITPGVPAGVHISQEYFGCAGIRGLNVQHAAFDFETLSIDVDKTKKIIEEAKPKIICFGASLFTFPHPVGEFRALADSIGARIWYDAAHVAGLIAGGLFQKPFDEGADVVTMSTHKTLPGPQGGAIVSNTSDEQMWRRIQSKVFPGLVSNHHLHKLPALAITLLEMREFGRAYAAQTVKNAQCLAQALHERGFDVLWERQGFTQSHQIVADVTKLGGGARVAEALEQANVIVNKNLLPYDDVKKSANPSGVRLGVQEMTRYGMREAEMEQIAGFIERVAVRNELPERVRDDVVAFRSGFLGMQYCFNE